MTTQQVGLMSPGQLEGVISAVHGEGSLTHPRKGFVSLVYTNLLLPSSAKEADDGAAHLWCMHELPIRRTSWKKIPRGRHTRYSDKTVHDPRHT